MDALGVGWRGFTKNLGALLGLVLANVAVASLFVGSGLGLFFATASTTTTSYGTSQMVPSVAGVLSLVLLSTIGGLVAGLLGTSVTKASLQIADGRRASFGDAFKGWSKGRALLTMLLVAGGTYLGMLLCMIPGVIFAFLAQYAVFFVVDRDMSPMEAIKASIAFTRAHLAEAIIWYLLASVVVSVGTMACYVGIVAAIPIVYVGQAYLFRRLQGQPAQEWH